MMATEKKKLKRENSEAQTKDEKKVNQHRRRIAHIHTYKKVYQKRLYAILSPIFSSLFMEMRR
jgi:hypothetical protein